MATTKPTAHPKDKGSSSVSSTPKRRTSRPSTPDDKEPANYLKPTASSRHPSDAPRSTCRPSLAAAGKRVISSNLANRTANKSPSPSRQPLRSPPSSTTKERAAKSPSPRPRTTVVPKPGADKATKTIRSGRTSPMTRARSFGTGTNAPKKREAHATSPTTTGSTTPDAGEEKHEPAIEVAPEEEVMPVEDELKLVDVPPAEDDVQEELTNPPEPKVLEESEPTVEAEGAETPLEPEQEQDAAKEVTDQREDERDETQESLTAEARAEPAVDATQEVDNTETAASAMPEPAHEAEEKKPEAVEAAVEVVAAAKKPDVVGRRKEAAPAGNAMIEERLVGEKRKNKVLALVGAFETVISLQEPEGGQQGNKTKESAESI